MGITRAVVLSGTFWGLYNYVSDGLVKYDFLVEIYYCYVGVVVARLWLHVSGSASMRIISLYMALHFVFWLFTCRWMLRTGFRTLMCVVCDGFRVWPMLVYEWYRGWSAYLNLGLVCHGWYLRVRFSAVGLIVCISHKHLGLWLLLLIGLWVGFG